MNIIELEAELTALETQASERGFFRPSADFHLHWIGDTCNFRLRLYLSDDDYTVDLEFKRGGFSGPIDLADLPALIQEASEWLAAQDTPIQRRERKFQKDLASLIEEGRDLQIPIVADLEATMKRLSSNILTLEASA